MLFNVGKGVRVLVHPAAERAGEGGELGPHHGGELFRCRGSCGSMHLNLLGDASFVFLYPQS